MNSIGHLPVSALATSLLLVGSACTSTPPDSTLHYGITSPTGTSPAQPLAKRAAAPKSAASRGNNPVSPGAFEDSVDLRLRSYNLRQEGGAAGQGAAKPVGGGADDVGKQLSNPVSNIWAMFTEFDYTKNNGKLTGGGDSKTVGVTTIFQPIMPIPLTENWKVITRPTVPIIWTTPVPKPSAGGVDFDRENGIGDSSLPLVPARNTGIKMGSGELVGGIGPTFHFPTATDDDLGTNTWEVGPAAVAVYKTPKTTWVAFPQYWWSYAETESDTPSTSHGSLLYAFYYELGNAWQVGTSPTITYNSKAPSGGKWNVPIGLTVAKTFAFGKRHIKFQLGMEYSIENADGYDKEVLLKLNIIPVIASPFGSPLF
jgi:hypothetical protein